jgi:hypothetical protein
LRTIDYNRISSADYQENALYHERLFSSGYLRAILCLSYYCSDTITAAISKPNINPKIAPAQGLAVIPQVLPEHLPR